MATLGGLYQTERKISPLMVVIWWLLSDNSYGQQQLYDVIIMMVNISINKLGE
jgi:hypothetical protein